MSRSGKRPKGRAPRPRDLIAGLRAEVRRLAGRVDELESQVTDLEMDSHDHTFDELDEDDDSGQLAEEGA